MTKEDQIAFVKKVIHRMKAEKCFQQAEAQYSRSCLAREKALKHRSHADEELQHAASETVKKYLALRNVSPGALHVRTNSGECLALCYLLPATNNAKY